MKLATCKDGLRDGRLAVVSRDLLQARWADGIATRMQQLLDDWADLSPKLREVSEALEADRVRDAFAFDPARCMAPLPRAYQWVDGSAFINHVELVRAARGSLVPASFYSDPLMYQNGSDDFLGPRDHIAVRSEAYGIDFEAEVAVIARDVPMGCSPEQALQGICLVMLANDVSLRNLIPPALAKCFGFVQGKPATAFSPVAVTVDELGDAWHDGRVDLPLASVWNGEPVGHCEAGPEMTFHFGELIGHLCKTRNVRAGSVIGSGTVSNKGVAGADGAVHWPRSYSCIAEKRAMEILREGEARTGYMRFGDTIQEMKDRRGASVFGAIEQKVVPAAPA